MSHARTKTNHHSRRLAALAAGTLTLATLGTATVASAAESPPRQPATPHTRTVTKTFTYTGKTQGFGFPDGVKTATVRAVGAAGGTGGSWLIPGGAGGQPTEIVTTINVEPNTSYYVDVGGHGGNGESDDSTGQNVGGYNGGARGGNDVNCTGGGGGGATELRIPQWLSSGASGSTADLRVVVAGGGGGGGGAAPDCHGGDAGSGDHNGSDGQDYSFVTSYGRGGGAASTTRGGSSGWGLCESGDAGGWVGGGRGGDSKHEGNGGGGGGGYFGGGGGGGAFYAGGGGGGGGSSYSAFPIQSATTATGVKDGQLTITYDLPI